VTCGTYLQILFMEHWKVRTGGRIIFSSSLGSSLGSRHLRIVSVPFDSFEEDDVGGCPEAAAARQLHARHRNIRGFSIDSPFDLPGPIDSTAPGWTEEPYSLTRTCISATSFRCRGITAPFPFLNSLFKTVGHGC